MDFQSVDAYLQLLPSAKSALYLKLSSEDRVKQVFDATETLLSEYTERQLSYRAVAIQTLYMLEGESEEYALLKRHGVTSFSTKGRSVSLDKASISPEVIKIIRGNGVGVGRLI